MLRETRAEMAIFLKKFGFVFLMRARPFVFFLLLHWRVFVVFALDVCYQMYQSLSVWFLREC